MSEITGIPRIGDAAPQFTAPSTHGEISLSQYAGKWIVLFSHPRRLHPGVHHGDRPVRP